jgi:hypothetical protein
VQYPNFKIRTVFNRLLSIEELKICYENKNENWGFLKEGESLTGLNI